MGWTGIWQWVIVLIIVLVLFGGRGKIAALMGDVGKGLRNFKSGLKGDEAEDAKPEEGAEAKPLPRESAAAGATASEKKDEAVKS